MNFYKPKNITALNIEPNEKDYIRALYTGINRELYPFVVIAVDSVDYAQSPIYDPDGITRETLAQLVDMTLNEAANHSDNIDEIRLNREKKPTAWESYELLNSNAEALIISEIFMYRRPKRAGIEREYLFENGKYKGINY